MGVSWSIFCDRHYEKLPLGKLSFLSDVEKFMKHALKGKIPKIPKWLSESSMSNVIWVFESIEKFRKRHKGCRLGYYSDYMDVGDYLDYYLEVDFEESLPTRDDYLAEVKKRAPMLIVPASRTKKTEYELFVVNVPPGILWDAKDKDKAEIELGVKRKVATFKKMFHGQPILDVEGNLQKSYEIYVYETVDGRLVKAYSYGQGTCEWITQKELEKLKTETEI